MYQIKKNNVVHHLMCGMMQKITERNYNYCILLKQNQNKINGKHKSKNRLCTIVYFVNRLLYTLTHFFLQSK